VVQVQDVWRIDDEWWREEVSRLYYRLLLEDGRRVTIYNDLISLDWHQQEY
jgi:aspartyl/asparaginyl beta-hydroxylase (cupin superfamily)